MARPFFETLRDLRGGMTLEELSSALSEVVAAVKATGRSGSLSLSIKIRPGRNGADYLHLEDEVTVKTPKVSKPDTIFYPTADNGLSRNDPRQRRLEFSAVDAQTGEISEVAHG